MDSDPGLVAEMIGPTHTVLPAGGPDHAMTNEVIAVWNSAPDDVSLAVEVVRWRQRAQKAEAELGAARGHLGARIARIVELELELKLAARDRELERVRPVLKAAGDLADVAELHPHLAFADLVDAWDAYSRPAAGLHRADEGSGR